MGWRMQKPNFDKIRERNIWYKKFGVVIWKGFEKEDKKKLVVAHTQENVLNCCTNWLISIWINYFKRLDKEKEKNISFYFQLCAVY